MIRQRLRIVHVYKDYAPVVGGIENHLRQLAEAQTDVGHQVTILVTNPDKLPNREEMNGVSLIRASRLATVASTPLSVQLPLILSRLPADIVHLHSPYPVAEMSQFLFGWKRPYVVTYHSDVVKQKGLLRFYRPFLQRFLARASRIITSNENYIQSSDFLRPLAEKCIAIPFAVDVERFQNARPLLPPVEIPTILFIGQHRYYKGVDDLIKAMSWVEARLLIGGSGPMRHYWESLARDLNIDHKVQFLGRIQDEDLPGFYASGDVFVLPSNSRAESFGIVLQEAMAAGLPCVTTDLGTGTSFLVRDRVSGFVIPSQNPKALAEALTTLVEKPQLRFEMGQAGQIRAAKEFSLDLMIRRIDRLYKEILA